MSAHDALPDPTRDACPDRASERESDARYYREVLQELIEIGTDLARALQRQSHPAQHHPARARGPAQRR